MPTTRCPSPLPMKTARSMAATRCSTRASGVSTARGCGGAVLLRRSSLGGSTPGPRAASGRPPAARPPPRSPRTRRRTCARPGRSARDWSRTAQGGVHLRRPHQPRPLSSSRVALAVRSSYARSLYSVSTPPQMPVSSMPRPWLRVPPRVEKRTMAGGRPLKTSQLKMVPYSANAARICCSLVPSVRPKRQRATRRGAAEVELQHRRADGRRVQSPMRSRPSSKALSSASCLSLCSLCWYSDASPKRSP